MKSGQQAEPLSAEAPVRRVRFGRRLLSSARVGIQSKLLVMLLAGSIMSVAVIGLVGYTTGRDELQQVATERLLELRASQKRQVEALFAELTNSLLVYSAGYSAVQAMDAFSSGFAQLANASINPAEQQSLVNYYTNQMIKPIDRLTGENLDISALLPTSNAQRYLQAHYTATFASAAEAREHADAGDGSAWSAANDRYHFYFRSIVDRFGYRDALLLDLQGNVVYSVNKGPDFGTNILTGPYRETSLRDAYQRALRANDVDFLWITDFQQYQPQLDAPTSWLVTPVGMSGKVAGVMALPVPATRINDIMNANRQWEAVGMGRTTETYLAGSDNLMRSDSRVFLENQQEYRREAIAAGTPPDVVDRAIRMGTTILIQPVPSAGLRAAQRGQIGVMGDTDYFGSRELEAYGPINIPNSDLHWSILATRDDSDAYERMAKFGKTLVLVVAGISFVICVASMLLAKLLVRPLRRLEVGTEKIASGDYNVTVPVTSRDEIGDLTAAFNEMSRTLKIKEELLTEQRQENDRLLLSLMPESVAQRYREGEETISQEHKDVAVIFADIAGLDDMPNELSGDQLIEMVADLFREFDSAAESLGVERIRTFHNGYLASCGATTPRLDNIHRSVEFALEIRRIIELFNNRSGTQLGLRAGINTGKVISGLVGRSSLVYDMWGGAVSLAYQMHSGATQPGIYVAAKVQEAMRDMWNFVPAGTISVGGTEQQIWRLTDQK